jgi:anti-sigma factor RsiW
MNCQRCQTELATLLLDAANPANAATQAHIDHCETCAAELHSLRATMALMEQWTAPEPSPFFDTRLHARLREEIAAPAPGLWERMRSRLLFNTNMHMRPIAASALALTLLIGGGSYAGFNLMHSRQAQLSATVQDLQSLDRNEQTISQMDQLDDTGSDDSSSPAANTQNP